MAAADSRTEAHNNGNAANNGHKRGQQPPQSRARAANLSPIESPSSTKYPYLNVADSAVEGDISPVESHQTSRTTFPRFRRPLVELSSGSQNKRDPKDRAMPSAVPILKPHLETPKTESAIPRRQHQVSTGTAMLLKPILKKHPTRINPAAQGMPQRKKHVHFTFGVNEDGLGAHRIPTPVQQQRTIPSPPPLRRRNTPLPMQQTRRAPSSTGNAHSHMMQDRARPAKTAPRSSSGATGIRHHQHLPQAAAQPQPTHRTLTAENLAVLSNQQKTRRMHMGRSHEDNDADDDDDVASNTDFELAVRMNERAMRMNRRRM